MGDDGGPDLLSSQCFREDDRRFECLGASLLQIFQEVGVLTNTECLDVLHVRAVPGCPARKFDAAEEATRKTKDAYLLDGPNFPRGEVHAWLAFAEKKSDDALRQMREVADLQDKVGKREVDIPAREMLAEMLLTLNRPQEALAEYENALKTDPNRFNGLAGAARAAELAHQTGKANTYYGQLLKNCNDGRTSDRPDLARAKIMVSKNGM